MIYQIEPNWNMCYSTNKNLILFIMKERPLFNLWDPGAKKGAKKTKIQRNTRLGRETKPLFLFNTNTSTMIILVR